MRGFLVMSILLVFFTRSSAADQRKYCSVPVASDELWGFYSQCLVEEKPNVYYELLQESFIAKQLTEKSGPASTGARFLGNTVQGMEMGIPCRLSHNCLKQIQMKFQLSKCQMESVLDVLRQDLLHVESWINHMDPYIEHKFGEYLSCLFSHENHVYCGPEEFHYRTIDGSCNNLAHPEWGKSMRPFARYLPPDYGDGFNSPRLDVEGDALPSARLVSRVIHTRPVDRDKDDYLTVMHMTMGQFLDHDTDKTAVSKLANLTENGEMGELIDVECGDDGCQMDGVENKDCFPIEVDDDDPDFAKPCLQFVRSQAIMQHDCRPGSREQLNQITSYLDLSMVYGSTLEIHEKIRDWSDHDRGRLLLVVNPLHKEAKHLLPKGEPKDCRETDDQSNCFTAGDARVNEQIGLMTVHTFFQRAHNTIEGKLHEINPHWSGETLFQETRKILTAAWQFIVYHEYLPPLLGMENMKKYRLFLNTKGYNNVYNEDLNADVTSTFATSAFRFAHSQIKDVLRLSDHTYESLVEKEFSSVLNRPALMFDNGLPGVDISGPDCITMGMISQLSHINDGFFSEQMQSKLFSENPPHEPGMDLASLDIQRGRDHGIPGYNAWRRYCGLPVASNFSDLIDIPQEVRLKFQSLYKHVDDVELFPAAMLECHVDLGVIGPTFACLIGQEFHKLRVADRFWFENSGYTGFTPDQLAEIRKYTLARFICDNADYIDNIQKYVMLTPLEDALNSSRLKTLDSYYILMSYYYGDNNKRRPCSEIPEPDLNMWKDSIHY